MIHALRTAEGAAALDHALNLAGEDQLSAVSALRRAGHPPDLAAAALTQATLRRRAAGKFGRDAAVMFFTDHGLQQATRPVVAARRAARLAADHRVRRVADLGCGIGSDAIALARAGLDVYAVDVDPETADVARTNCDALGLGDRVTVVCADARTVDLDGVDAVFCDPARRSGTRRVFDPTGYSPPWEAVVSLAERVPRTVVKLAPGIDHELVPPGVEAEWVSVNGDVVEAALWHGPLASAPRRASVLQETGDTPSGAVPSPPDVTEITGSGQRTGPVGPIRAVLYDPDGAVVRAHLVAELADRLGATLLDPRIAYLTSDTATPTSYARGYAIREVLPFSLKRLRAALRGRDVGRVTVKKRGSPLEPEQLRKDLRLTGSREVTVVLTRVAGRPYALLVDPL